MRWNLWAVIIQPIRPTPVLSGVGSLLRVSHVRSLIWIKYVDNSTNRIISISVDGYTLRQNRQSRYD